MFITRGVQGVVKNAFYTPNQNCEKIDSFWDKDASTASGLYHYEFNEKENW